MIYVKVDNKIATRQAFRRRLLMRCSTPFRKHFLIWVTNIHSAKTTSVINTEHKAWMISARKRTATGSHLPVLITRNFRHFEAP